MIDVAAEKNRSKIQRALPVGICGHGLQEQEIRGQLDELAKLISNLGIIPLEPLTVRSDTVSSRFLTGTGKAEKIAQLAQECEAEALVFDNPLSPSQQRNWERLSGMPVYDREEIILDIFAGRAITREAVLQVELARTKYYLPRLSRAWTHLSRQQGGGATTRGEGETQIETDRRLLRRRISRLEKELDTVRRQRNVQRKARQRSGIPVGAIVGYTNAGKSSLLKALAGADILVEDKLFATLDPSTRRVLPGRGAELLLTDTVGFVRNLPHTLVEAFKSTLEEAVLADFLLLVLDISSPALDAEIETTLTVLRELGAECKRIITVFNKTDLIDPECDAVRLAALRVRFPDAFYISAETGSGLDELRDKLAAVACEKQAKIRVKLPPDRSDLAALAHSAGRVLKENYNPDGSLDICFSIGPEYRHKYMEFVI